MLMTGAQSDHLGRRQSHSTELLNKSPSAAEAIMGTVAWVLLIPYYRSQSHQRSPQGKKILSRLANHTEYPSPGLARPPSDWWCVRAMSLGPTNLASVAVTKKSIHYRDISLNFFIQGTQFELLYTGNRTHTEYIEGCFLSRAGHTNFRNQLRLWWEKILNYNLKKL